MTPPSQITLRGLSTMYLQSFIGPSDSTTHNDTAPRACDNKGRDLYDSITRHTLLVWCMSGAYREFTSHVYRISRIRVWGMEQADASMCRAFWFSALLCGAALSGPLMRQGCLELGLVRLCSYKTYKNHTRYTDMLCKIYRYAFWSDIWLTSKGVCFGSSNIFVEGHSNGIQ